MRDFFTSTPRPIVARPLFRSSSIRSLSFSSCRSFGTYVRSLGISGRATAVVVADAFTNVEEVRVWSGGEPAFERDESLVDESKHPPLERGDHNNDGTGI